MTKRLSFDEARRTYVNRFTADHIPAWALIPARDGKFYAPQFSSDREWYEHTLFPGEPGHPGGRKHCYTTGQTWPRGQWLERPFTELRAA